MLCGFSKAIVVTALLAAMASSPVRGGAAGSELCALPTASLETAVAQHADCADALKEIKKQAIATWYTDRESVQSYTKKIADITAHCDASSRMTLVVYGLPNKDCDAGYSSDGSNKNAEDYKKWVQLLADGVGQRKVLYVLEPDAVGLLAKGGCGTRAGYSENVKAALQILSKNPNADIYMDVGYWTLMSESDAKSIAKTLKELAQGGRLKGIALNTSNYRSNKQISELCANFQKAYGDNSLHCIVDTSRNFNDAPPSSEWCNAKFGGVGRPPTANTGFSNLDYFIWIKPAGESDGSCAGHDHTKDAMKGPGAGQFYKEHFVHLWNNGYFVKEKNFPVIGGNAPTPAATVPGQYTPTAQVPVSTTPASTQASTTTPPISQSPVAQTTAPVSQSPIGSTSAPTTTVPAPVSTSVTPTEPINTLPAAQYATPTSATPASEVRENKTDAPAPTPASSKPKKHKKKSKKCESGLEQLPGDAEAENAEAGVKPAAPVAAPANTTTKAMSLSATSVADAAAAPEVEPVTLVDGAASTKTNESSGSGLGDGAVAAIVAVGAMIVAVGAVILRRRGEARRRANTMRTPVEIFGQVNATPAPVTML